MSRKTSSRVNTTPDMSHEKPAMPCKHKVARNRKRVVRIFTFWLPKSSGFSAVKFFRRLRSKVANALCMVSMKQRRTASCSSNSNTTTSSSSNMMRSRSRSFVPPTDSHQSEAIEDCIEFINSSSSFQRSNSVRASSSSSS